MKQANLPINLSLEEIKQFCQRHSIRKLSLFSSVLRDDFTKESDVDVLVEFELTTAQHWLRETLARNFNPHFTSASRNK